MNPPLGGHVCSDLGFGGDGGQAAAGEDVEAEVAAAFGPFVGLFGQDRADEADDRLAVRQDPDRVGAAPDLPVQPFGEVIRPDLGPDLGGEAGEGEDVGAGRVEVVMNLRQLLVDVSPTAGREEPRAIILPSETAIDCVPEKGLESGPPFSCDEERCKVSIDKRKRCGLPSQDVR